MHARFALVLSLAGCRQLLGLDDPVEIEPDANAAPSADAAVDAGPNCPASYVPIGSSRYRFVEMRARWLDAVTLCANDQPFGPSFTHLVVIGSDVEREALLPSRSPTNDAYWIGLTDLSIEGKWQWVTAEPNMMYPPASGEPWSPDQPMAGANCAVIVGPMYGFGVNGLFSADYCEPPATVSLPYICECDAYANDSSRY